MYYFSQIWDSHKTCCLHCNVSPNLLWYKQKKWHGFCGVFRINTTLWYTSEISPVAFIWNTLPLETNLFILYLLCTDNLCVSYSKWQTFFYLTPGCSNTWTVELYWLCIWPMYVYVWPFSYTRKCLRSLYWKRLSLTTEGRQHNSMQTIHPMLL